MEFGCPSFFQSNWIAVHKSVEDLSFSPPHITITLACGKRNRSPRSRLNNEKQFFTITILNQRGKTPANIIPDSMCICFFLSKNIIFNYFSKIPTKIYYYLAHIMSLGFVAAFPGTQTTILDPAARNVNDVYTPRSQGVKKHVCNLNYEKHSKQPPPL